MVVIIGRKADPHAQCGKPGINGKGYSKETRKKDKQKQPKREKSKSSKSELEVRNCKGVEFRKKDYFMIMLSNFG